MGVWQCSKCKAKFTSKAYSVGKVGIKTEEVEEGSVIDKKEKIKVSKVKEDKEKWHSINVLFVIKRFHRIFWEEELGALIVAVNYYLNQDLLLRK